MAAAACRCSSNTRTQSTDPTVRSLSHTPDGNLKQPFGNFEDRRWKSVVRLTSPMYASPIRFRIQSSERPASGMNSRLITFTLATVALVVLRILVTVGRRRGQPFFEDIGERLERWSLRDLLLASFLTLFAELAFIRWIAVEIRVFAYFKNLALLLCFVGFGLGCALPTKKVRWSAAVTAFMGLLLIVRIPWSQGPLERLSQNLGAAADVNIWATGNQWRWVPFCGAALLAAALFLLIVVVFIL